jgi:hypothetical protein
MQRNNNEGRALGERNKRKKKVRWRMKRENEKEMKHRLYPERDHRQR